MGAFILYVAFTLGAQVVPLEQLSNNMNMTFSQHPCQTLGTILGYLSAVYAQF